MEGPGSDGKPLLRDDVDALAGKPLLSSGGQVYQTERARWYILFVFSCFSFNQCLFWFTFSSIKDDKVYEYYNGLGANGKPKPGPVDDSAIALLLNWGPIIGIAMFPFQAWLLTRAGGFQRATFLGAALTFSAALLRTIPSWAGSARHAIWLLHLAQILNAAAGPLCMGTESRLACMWFAEDERTTATAIAVTSNAVGTTVGFLLGPGIVKTAGDLPTLLFVELAMGAVPFVCALVYLPKRPRHFPSAAAEALDDASMAGGAAADPGAPRRPTFLEGLMETLRNRHYLVLVLAAGIMAGVSAAWQSLFQDILNPIGYSDSTVGYLGFANGLAGNVGSVTVGYLSDTYFRRRFKRSIIWLLGLLLLSTLWFTLSLPAFGQPAVLPRTLGSLFVACILAGVANSSMSPLFYELCAELTYPVSEGTSAGFLALIWNTASFIMIYLSPVISAGSVNVITTITIGVVLLMVLSVKEQYKRPSSAQ
eukprot:g4009.t1